VKAIEAPLGAYTADPEAATALAEIRRLLERAVDSLPDHFRIVFVMRDVEEMSTEATALLLGLRSQTVKHSCIGHAGCCGRRCRSQRRSRPEHIECGH